MQLRAAGRTAFGVRFCGFAPLFYITYFGGPAKHPPTPLQDSASDRDQGAINRGTLSGLGHAPPSKND